MGEPTKSEAAGAAPKLAEAQPAHRPEVDTGESPSPVPKVGLKALTLAALGVVFGDIGTSPLYAIKECFHGPHAVTGGATQANVLGVLSLVLWSLTGVIALKYLAFIMRADNKGEGGIFALLALIPSKADRPLKTKVLVVTAALFGASLLYGDGIITPAISVLSAVEGLGVATKAAEQLVVPLTCGILFGLFWFQRRGTHGIGRVFGPVMAVWFVAIAVLGLRYVLRAPEVLGAVNPYWAVRFFLEHRVHGMVVLGSVVLVITGGEALYADMGHFGKAPIRLAWFGVTFPALLLNYFGQGAILLENPAAAANPFYAMVPGALLYPMVALATAATVIASQAMISGAFSMTRQAVQLGYFPRVTIVHTSAETEGQIYIPEVNQALMVSCLLLVLGFKSSSGLAAAYGIAVTGNMAITSTLFFFVATRAWGWPVYKALPLCLAFLAFDLSFFGASLLKFKDGGWFPVAVAAGVYVLMTTWKTGRSELARRFAQNTIPLDALLEDVNAMKPHRVRGTAVFMSSSPQGTPPVLLHHLKHNQVLHQQVVLLSVMSADVPAVPRKEQLTVEPLGNGFFRVVARFGFMQTPNVPEILRSCRKQGLVAEAGTTSYYLGKESLLTGGNSRMMKWRKKLFAFVSRNARPATAYFGIPPGRVVEMGMQVDL
ncbi:MAG: potassium transporter Kup [Myxococcales bacterium]|nr:potassium transporter Kup [Myxococcales bacterium]